MGDLGYTAAVCPRLGDQGPFLVQQGGGQEFGAWHKKKRHNMAPLLSATAPPPRLVLPPTPQGSTSRPGTRVPAPALFAGRCQPAQKQAPRRHRVCQSALGVRRSAAAAVAEKSNPLGVHANVWVGTWSPDESRVAIAKTAELGYDLIEVPVFEPESIDAPLTKALLKEHGIGASASLGLSLDTDISSADPAVSQRGVELLLRALKATVEFGGTHLVGVTHSAIAKYPYAFPGGKARENLVAGLRTVSQRAADAGVVFGLEVINRYESNVLNTAAQAMDLIAEIDHPNVVVHLDSYHMNIEESSMADAVATCAPRLGYVHIGECHRGYLGSGSVDFEQLFRALARAKYQGPITFESFSSRVVSPALSNNLAVWRNLWDDSEDLASHAKGYMDFQIKAAQKACFA